MNMTPVLALWDGKSYGDILSGPDLEPFVDDILNELEVGYTKRLSLLINIILKMISTFLGPLTLTGVVSAQRTAAKNPGKSNTSKSETKTTTPAAATPTQNDSPRSTMPSIPHTPISPSFHPLVRRTASRHNYQRA